MASTTWTGASLVAATLVLAISSILVTTCFFASFVFSSRSQTPSAILCGNLVPLLLSIELGLVLYQLGSWKLLKYSQANSDAIRENWKEL